MNNSFNIRPTDNKSDNLCLIGKGKNNNSNKNNNNEDKYSRTSYNKMKSVFVNVHGNEINKKK